MILSSPIYWTPGLYRTTMKLLYGDQFVQRYRVVANLVPDGSRVTELCCGCGFLYEHFLMKKGVDYLGVDLLPGMVGRLKKQGVRTIVGDVADMEFEETDYCLMLGSLYHFRGKEAQILNKMAESGRGILLEPVINISRNSNALVGLIGKTLSYVENTTSSYRFNSEQLDQALSGSDVKIISDELVIDKHYRLVQFEK